MAIIYLEELGKHVSNKYLAVNVIAKRARSLNDELLGAGLSKKQKPVSVATEELASGQLVYKKVDPTTSESETESDDAEDKDEQIAELFGESLAEDSAADSDDEVEVDAELFSESLAEDSAADSDDEVEVDAELFGESLAEDSAADSDDEVDAEDSGTDNED